MATRTGVEINPLLNRIYNKLAESDNKAGLVEERIRQVEKSLEEKAKSDEKNGERGKTNGKTHESQLERERLQGLYILRRDLISHSDDLIDSIEDVEKYLTGSQKKEICDSLALDK